jgi:hypothetical protein
MAGSVTSLVAAFLVFVPLAVFQVKHGVNLLGGFVQQGNEEIVDAQQALEIGETPAPAARQNRW